MGVWDLSTYKMIVERKRHEKTDEMGPTEDLSSTGEQTRFKILRRNLHIICHRMMETESIINGLLYTMLITLLIGTIIGYKQSSERAIEDLTYTPISDNYDTLFLKCEIELSDQDVIIKDQWGHFDGLDINPTVLEDQPDNIQIRNNLKGGVHRAIN